METWKNEKDETPFDNELEARVKATVVKFDNKMDSDAEPLMNIAQDASKANGALLDDGNNSIFGYYRASIRH